MFTAAQSPVTAARLGSLTTALSDTVIATPAAFLYTRNGAVPHLTNDVAAAIPDSAPAMLPLAHLCVARFAWLPDSRA